MTSERTASKSGRVLSMFLTLAVLSSGVAECKAAEPDWDVPDAAAFEALRLAIEDLIDTFGPRYPAGADYLARLQKLETARPSGNLSVEAEFGRLKQAALLDNPLLSFDRLLLLKRKRGQLGLPVNHKCNAGIPQKGYDNEIAVLSPVRAGGTLRTLFRPDAGQFVGEVDLHFDADRLLLTMPREGTWQLHELRLDSRRLRQITPGEHSDVDNFDGCYLPDGRIVFASTASYTAVPCWHGKERACNIFRIDADGRNMRQLCFDQDLDLHPAVLPSGQVIFSRWDYTGPLHIYLRPLMVMNPDGSGQRAAYGSNSYWPNALYFPRGIPGVPNKLVAVVSGYHGVPRMGELVLLDLTKGTHEAEGVVQRVPGRGKPIDPIIRDNLVDRSWPKFLHPYPLSEKYFLVAAQLGPKKPWGIYLVDVFDNILPIQVLPQFDLFEPIPVRKTPRPPVIPDRVDTTRDDAVVYLHDVYAGPGLDGVPRGTIRRLRIVAYHFGYPGMAGPDKIGCGGPWEVMRILGTVPVDKDGSTAFRVPAGTPICVQPLDAQGKAVQLMRSWFTAMPGEVVSCVGCHERAGSTPLVRREQAATRSPVDIEPWRGPARGFDFEREVQPVLDRYCVGCHNDQPLDDGRTTIDLRAQHHFENYRGRQLTKLGATRLHPAMREALGGTSLPYTPAYEALIPYVRRVNIEDHVGLLVPGEYHADTSELIQMLAKGHYRVQLDDEARDRLITWIDLNGPCHGTWNDICPIPEGADRRRRELSRLYGGPAIDPEAIVRPVVASPGGTSLRYEGRGDTAKATPFVPQGRATGRLGVERDIDLGEGLSMKLVRIPAGRFLMGSTDGEADERPRAEVSIDRAFWMGVCEVTNEQFRRFDRTHRSGLFTKRFQGPDGPGLSLEGAQQPAVRVSWEKAVAFCRWLTDRTDARLTLPTEAQWEYACRSGTATPLAYGDVTTDFSAWANVADRSLSVPPGTTGGLESNITAHFGKGIFLSAVYGGNIVCDVRHDDRSVATATTGSYRPNAWGLHDMHGNVAEWTRTVYRPYPYDEDDGPGEPSTAGRKVIRGGSWVDRPERCRSAFRLGYPAWQRVHNVGFRVVCSTPPGA
ncbi:MAG: SUMF1/EgtB/PvdO family nonheme iron enzyme [Thermoguttaceae bacterium]